MAPRTKKQKAHLQAYELKKSYNLVEGIALIQKITKTKFDGSIDIAVNLGIDPKKPLQMIHGHLSLPHGTGKVPTILVICTPEKEEEAKAAGAEYVGLDPYIQKIEQGWTDFDILVTMPNLMTKLAKLGKILGPIGLMPNLKKNTITMEIGKTIQAIKAGQIAIKTDKAGIVHSSVGRISFPREKIKENIQAFIAALLSMKHNTIKGNYIQRITLSSTMSPSVEIQLQSITQLIPAHE